MSARGREVGLAVVAACVLASGCESPPSGAGPALEVRLHGDGDLQAERPGADDVRRAAALAVGMLLSTSTPADLADLAEALEEMSDRVEARAHPLGIDMGEGEPNAAVVEWLSEHAASVSVARATARGRWQSADGSMSVRLIRGCEEAGPETRCVLAWRRSGDEIERRARFLAGPLSRAVLLRAGHEADAAALARGLAEARGRAGSTIALVVRRDEGRAKGDGEQRARAAAKRSIRFLDRMPADDRAWLGALARSDDGPALAEIGLDPAHVLVVPRLSADSARCEAEIEGVLASGRFEAPIAWERRPGD